MIYKIILWTDLALLFLHEMDAVRTMEWKMMIFINRIEDHHASKIFIGAHFVMFAAVFFMLEYYFMFLYWFICISLIFHQILHYVFRKHSSNRMNNGFSEAVIILMTIISFAGIIYGLYSIY